MSLIQCESFAKSGNTTTLVFSAAPDGWLDLLGAGVQSYISGDKEWSQVVEEAKANWSELRKK
jgi:raffinose/stachyose/melibiose transport system substrate-binding protein